MQTLILYHGSDHIVEKPTLHGGKLYNDYGQGFYCTKDVELAGEWACASEKGGFCNRYKLRMDELNILDLNDEKYSILNWMAVLVANRKIKYRTGMEQRAAEFLIDQYLPDLSGADIVTGYRADDSYFSFARSFLGNSITIEQLKTIIHLGDLGQQICLKSEKAFASISFIDAEVVKDLRYLQERNKQNQNANKMYSDISAEYTEGTLISDLIRGTKSF